MPLSPAGRSAARLSIRKTFLSQLRPAFLDVLAGPWGDGGPETRSDARRFETSETSVALLLGLGAALKHARALGIASIRTRIAALAETLRHELARVPGVSLQDLGTERSGLVSFTVKDVPAQIVRTQLAAQRIAIGANGVPYTPLDMQARGLGEIARASISYFNTESELGRLCEAVANLTTQ